MISTNYINNIQRKRKWYGIAGALITLAIPFYLYLGNGNNHLETDQSFCPFKMLTGFPCPGCGITKSLVYCYAGDFSKSVHYHILGPFVIAFCIITIAVLLTEIFTGKEYFKSWLYNKKLAYVLAVFLMVYHLIRVIYFIHDHTWDEIARQSIWK
ncbi:MAG: DUF2752 domain-containing protein [Bacteroidetes bacterium]|nr:DUF2752 domain-containing protein [Bacteroidota bacterium]